MEIKLKVFNNFFRCFSILCLVLHSKLAALKIFYPEKTTWQAIDWIKKIFTLKKIITILEMSLIFLIGRSIVCHDALSFETSTNHFVQRIEVWQQMNMSNQNFYLKKRNGNCSDFLNFFPRGSICFNSSIFARDMSNYILVGNFEGNFVKIFAENVVSGNSVQIGPNFPAKSLSIYTKNFSPHF